MSDDESAGGSDGAGDDAGARGDGHPDDAAADRTSGDPAPRSDDAAASDPPDDAADHPDDAAAADHPDDAGDHSDDAATEPRHDRVTVHPTSGPGNSMAAWWRRARNPLRVGVNYAVIWLVRVSPSLKLKRWLLRRLGATVGPGVSIGLEATVDVFWPDRVTIREDAIVGYDATLLCHEFLQDEFRTGEVVVGERAMVGAGAVVLPGVEVGAEAQVAANSLVTRDVPPGATVAGVPATMMGSGKAGDERAAEAAEKVAEAAESDEPTADDEATPGESPR